MSFSLAASVFRSFAFLAKLANDTKLCTNPRHGGLSNEPISSLQVSSFGIIWRTARISSVGRLKWPRYLADFANLRGTGEQDLTFDWVPIVESHHVLPTPDLRSLLLR